MSTNSDSVVTSFEELLKYYRTASHPNNLYTGIEWERSGIYRDNLGMVPYEGDRGYLAVLKKLVSEAGWEIVSGHRNNIYELKRGKALVTIEGDGRLELSGSPQANLHDLGREFRIHLNEVKEISDFLNIAWMPLGLDPLNNWRDIKFVEKKRYHISREFYTKDKDLYDIFMNVMNGFHANFSFTDERNAIIKAQTLFRITPVLAAIFSTSPFFERKRTEYLNYRRKIFKDFAPERHDLPKNILEHDFSFEDWLSFYIKKPVNYIMGKGKKKDFAPNGVTFGQWMKNGHEGIYPTYNDFDIHVKSIYSDIRLRPLYLEYRALDTVPYRYVMSVPALIKGLIFDSSSWKQVHKLTKDWSYEDIMELDKRAWKEGLQAEIGGKNLLWYAKALLHIANESLHKFARTNGVGSDEDEAIYLAPIKDQIYIKEKSLAEEMVYLWENDWKKDFHRMLEWCESGG